MYRSRAALFFLKSGLHPVRGGFKSLNRACVGCEMEFKSLNQACVRCEMEFKSLNRACVRREMEFKNFSGAQPWWPRGKSFLFDYDDTRAVLGLYQIPDLLAVVI